MQLNIQLGGPGGFDHLSKNAVKGQRWYDRAT